MADCDASQCVEETIPKVPCSVGRVVKVMRCSLALSVVRTSGPVPSGDTRWQAGGAVADVPQRGHLGDAAVEGERAAGVEPAPGRRVEGRRQVVAEQDRPAGPAAARGSATGAAASRAWV